MSSEKVAIVTGSNKGIGYAVVKSLTDHFDGVIYLCSRDEKRGNEALEKLRKEVGEEKGKKVRFHQLDVTKQESVDAFKEHVKNTHGGLEVLINNAAIAYPPDSTVPMGEQAEVTMETNFYGVIKVCRAFMPLMRQDARGVIVASRIGYLSMGAGPELKKSLADPDLTPDKLISIVEDFKKHAKAGDLKENGFPTSAYGMSKQAVIALSKIQHHKTKNGPKKWIINACCPGFVDTDMTNHTGVSTPEEGADTIVWLATLPPGTTTPKGEFVAERKILDWENGKMEAADREAIAKKMIEKLGEEKANEIFARWEKNANQ